MYDLIYLHKQRDTKLNVCIIRTIFRPRRNRWGYLNPDGLLFVEYEQSHIHELALCLAEFGRFYFATLFSIISLELSVRPHRNRLDYY